MYLIVYIIKYLYLVKCVIYRKIFNFVMIFYLYYELIVINLLKKFGRFGNYTWF